MNPGPFLQLDRVIHEKGRLAIMEGRVIRIADGALLAESTGHFMAWQ